MIIRNLWIGLQLSMMIMNLSHAMDEGDPLGTLERKAGQLMISGFKGTTPIDPDVQDICLSLKQGYLGGVVLYGYNIVNKEQLSTLTQTLREAKSDVIIAIDEEGGRVRRLTTAKGFAEFPSAFQVAQSKTPEEAEQIYSDLAFQLKTLGINLNFGPVVDLHDAISPAIGHFERSFSENPEKVIEYASHFIESHRKHHILTCLKHFPGHGLARGDTHKDLTDTTQLAQPELELAPYYRLMQLNQVDMIMTAHIINQNMDPDNHPATLSGRIIPSLLRDKKFNGIVISDDLCMGAISKHYSLNDTIKQCFGAATCDYLMWSRNPSASPEKSGGSFPTQNVKQMTEYLAQLIQSGEIPSQRLTESYERNLSLRAKLNS